MTQATDSGGSPVDTVLAAFGVASVVLAVAFVLGIAPAAVLGPIVGLDATLATGVLGAGLVGYALRRRRLNDAAPGLTRLRYAGEAEEPADPGEGIDAALSDIEAGTSEVAVQEHRQTVRSRLQRTAVRAYEHRYSVPRDDAVDAIARGAWTDDVVAAAFLGDERAPPLPIRERLWAWLHPRRAYRRRTDRAAAAVHDLALEATR